MPCPTCDHTMQPVAGAGTVRRVFWCPRCGTLKVETWIDNDPPFEEHEAPKLVERCRAFEAAVIPQYREPAWTTSGIAESINLPGDRPKGDQ